MKQNSCRASFANIVLKMDINFGRTQNGAPERLI